MKVVGYVRLSRDGAGRSHSLDGQREAIANWCRSNGHDLVTVIAEVGSAKRADRLRGRQLAIAAVKAGMGEALVVRDLDRATRSVKDGGELLEDAKESGWRLIGAVDHIDTGDEEQEFAINIRIAVAQEERRKLARRTRDGIATARRNGSRIGRPPSISAKAQRRIAALTAEGHSGYRIAKILTEEGIAAPSGGKVWAPSVVRAAIKRATVPNAARKVA